MIIDGQNYRVGVLLTQWKRNHLEVQLSQVVNQSMKPDYIVVYQNENHVDVSHIVQKYDAIHVKSDFNTKYFGRFAYFFTLPVDICIVMDDDIIPGVNCFQTYVEQCVQKNSIIGGNGRHSFYNEQNLPTVPEYGIRPSMKYDFVGHLWCFKKDWLYMMFSIKPYTFDTGEDMHLCYSCKLLGHINSFTAEHKTNDESCDIACNGLSADQVASFLSTPRTLRCDVEKFWQSKGITFLNQEDFK